MLKVVLISSCTGTCIGSIPVCCHRVVNKDSPFVVVVPVDARFIAVPVARINRTCRSHTSHLCLKGQNAFWAQTQQILATVIIGYGQEGGAPDMPGI
jgi:hypothetical protein